MKGDSIKSDFSEYKDSITGKIIIQLTPSDGFNHHPYFYNKIISNDSKYLIYGNKTRGRRNVFKMDLFEGTSIQLTDADGINDFNVILSNDDKFVIFTKNRQIIRLNIDSLDEEIVYEIPKGWALNEESTPSLSSDDRFVVLPEIASKDLLQAEGDWSIFAKQWGQMPKCRIVITDIKTKKSEIIHQENYWIGEVQFRPMDNATISFCHEGPWHVIDARIWLINSDGTNLRCAKQRVGKEQFGHEYWLKDGSKIGFIYFPRFYGRNASIRFIDPDTLEEEVLMECSNYSHFISNHNNSKIVGDGHGRKNDFIYLVDVKQKKEEILCEHGSSWKTYGHTQDSHPHPAFSPDSSMIIFTSDRTGSPSIYRVDLD